MKLVTTIDLPDHMSVGKAHELLVWIEQVCNQKGLSAQIELEGTSFRLGEASEDVSLEDLSLPVRTFYNLRRAGIDSLSVLLKRSEAQLLQIPNIGKKSVEEIKETLEERGLRLKE